MGEKFELTSSFLSLPISSEINTCIKINKSREETLCDTGGLGAAEEDCKCIFRCVS
jgi:hypothetical protein